jgi:hypothetical protein
MPTHIRALIVLFVIAGVSYLIARRTIVGLGVAEADYNRRTVAWFIVTALAFLCGHFFLFMVLSGLVVLVASRQERNPTALFIWLLFAVPMFSKEIPGFAGVRYIFELQWPRLLALLVLLPAAIHLNARARQIHAHWLASDYFVLAFLAIQLGLRFQDDTLTNTARFGFYAIIDVGLPYYVASRGLRTLAAQREALAAVLVTVMVLAVLGCYEILTRWNLFSRLTDLLGADFGYGTLLGRSGVRRVFASTGHPLAYGFVLMVATCLYAYLSPLVRSPIMRRLGWFMLVAGLAASVSRGPWVGAVVGMLVYAVAWGVSGSKAIRDLLKVALGLGVLVAGLLASPWSATIIDLIPFVGSVESETIEYRVQLLNASIALLVDQPWFGVPGFFQQLADQKLVIGGIVDLVNTYLGIALANGAFALIAFVGAFVTVVYQIVLLLRTRAKANAELMRLGSALLAAIAGTMVTIMTTSSIVVIPIVYWTLLGIGAGYVVMLKGVPQPSRQMDQRTRPGQRAPALPASSTRGG